MKASFIAACAVGALVCSGWSVQAQPPGTGAQELTALLVCRNEPDDQTRLRCYDAAAATLASATEAGSVVVVDREEIRRTRRSLFGFNLPRLPFFRGDDSQDEEELREIEGTVRSSRQAEHGKWVVTLEDGSVWQTTEVNTRMATPRTGQSVRIRRAALGSYFISFGGSAGVRAMRIR